MSIISDKNRLRSYMKSLSAGYSPSWEETVRLWERVASFPGFENAFVVLAYMSLPDELDTSYFLEKHFGAKRLAIPLVKGSSLVLKEYSPQSLVKGYKGILEPSGDSPVISPSEIDFAIIPGVAFDRVGHRLGRGKGFYDRLLPFLNCPCIGVGQHFRLVDSVPVEPWDAVLDGVMVTDDYMKNENSFNAEKTANELIDWLKDYFNKAGSHVNAILGMSGGKDSTVAAAVLCKAIGPERVIGVSMPQGGQSLNEADKICEYLGMKMLTVNIGGACEELIRSVADAGEQLSDQSIQNIPPRVRMTTLYAIGQTNNARVVNTCNLSEDYIGYATKFGDGAGDFSVFANLTVTEVLAIGDYLGIPYKWVHKVPDDGLPHSCPDEEKIGFSYAELDIYLRTGKAPEGYVHDNPAEGLKIDKIELMHSRNLHKLQPMPSYRLTCPLPSISHL